MSETFRCTCPISTRGSIGSLIPESLVGRRRRLRDVLREVLGALERLLRLDLGLAQPLLRTGFVDLRVGGLVLAQSIGGSGSGSGGAGSGCGSGSGSGGSEGGLGGCGSITVTPRTFPRGRSRNSSRAGSYARAQCRSKPTSLRAGRIRCGSPRAEASSVGATAAASSLS